ncbi:MAG: hypothetical protein GY854_06785 [Deltaproteobacteria bacterium]|nr:hypothetical protein [Deltaproteobacteria bacterium]
MQYERGSLDHISVDKQTEIVNYVSAAALEETLHCMERDRAFKQLKEKYPEVGQFMHN